MTKKASTELKEFRDRQEAVKQAAECMGCMHQGLIVTDSVGVVTETNLATERIFETPSLTLNGSDIHTWCVAPASYDELIHHANEDHRSLNRPILVQGSTGKRKLVNMSIQRVGERETAQYVHVFQDCADLRTMEERLLQTERLATVGKFASQIAHEIRNPLNSISLNVELLEDELRDSSKDGRILIRSVLRELDRLNEIVTEYLRFSRFPKPNLMRGRVDSVILELARIFKPPASVKLEVALFPSSPEVWLDQNLLRQALENLVRNGAEAITGPGVVTIETDVIDRFLVIRVKDTGEGIPLEAQSKLFQPFFTTKASGTGLGLATSQQIIFEHNGHLLMESEPRKGTTFTTLLPL